MIVPDQSHTSSQNSLRPEVHSTAAQTITTLLHRKKTAKYRLEKKSYLFVTNRHLQSKPVFKLITKCLIWRSNSRYGNHKSIHSTHDHLCTAWWLGGPESFPQNFFVVLFTRDAMLARVIAIATCLSVCLSVRLSVCPSICHAPVLCQNVER